MFNLHGRQCREMRELLRVYYQAATELQKRRNQPASDIQTLYAQIRLDAQRVMRVHESYCHACRKQQLKESSLPEAMHG